MTQQVIASARCNCVHCGKPMMLPLKHDWSDPLYVMHMEEEHRRYGDLLSKLHADMIELAGECVEAGVRPSILKRADELNALFKALKQVFEIE